MAVVLRSRKYLFSLVVPRWKKGTWVSFTLPQTSNYNRADADVAQLVEQSIRNRQVIGSSPIVGSTKLLRIFYFPT
jgi:hypothetical protein